MDLYNRKEYRDTVEEMKTQIENTKIILGDYDISKKKSVTRERELKFHDIFMDNKKKYWNKYKLDRLGKKDKIVDNNHSSYWNTKDL